MNVWTDGTGTLVLSPVGLSLHVDEDATLLCPADALGYEEKKSRLEASRWHERQPLAADGEAGWVWLLDFDGRPVAVSFDGGAPVELDENILEITALEETGAAAAVIGTDGGAEVRRGEWQGEQFEWGQTWELPDEIARVDWPDAIWDASEAPWGETEEWSGRGASMRISRSPFGVCVTDAQTGLVGLKRDTAADGSFETALRFPGQYEATLNGSVTDEGVTTTLTVEDRDACMLHVADDGEVLFSDEGWNLSTVTVVDGTHALVARDGSSPTVEFWNLEAGEIDRRMRSSWSSRGRLTLATDDARHLLVMGLGHTAVIAGRETDEWREFEEIELPEPEVDEEEEDPDMAGKVYGDPSFAFVEREDEPEWRFEADSEFEIVLPVANEGGDGEGIDIEVEGAALDDGLIDIDSVEIDDEEIEFDDGEAQFPDRRLKAAREAIDGNVPVETIEVTIHGEAKSDGHGLLMIRVGPSETGRRATVMRGRGVTVE